MVSVCRICLAGNTRLYTVKIKPLLFQYKQLTNTKFNYNDPRPRALCCFCYQKLLKCHIFSQMALRSEKMFSHIYDKGLEVTHDHITEANLDIKHHVMYVTATQFNITINDNFTEADLQDHVTVKFEPLSGIDIEQEVSTESDKFVEVGSCLEDCTKIELINITIDSNVNNADLQDQVTVKDKPLPDIDIKQEATESDKYVEVGSSLEKCTKSKSTYKNNNDQDNDVKDFIFGIHVEQTRPDDSETSFSCNNCNKIFYIKSKLITHIRNSHSQVKRKQYSSTKKHTEMTSAIETNQNLKNKFTCYVCTRSFLSKSVLIRHIRIHTGEKAFACKECDKQFNKKKYLVQHMKTHTGEKAFVCNLCEKQFNLRKYLIQHIRTHTAEKPFACNACDKQFILKAMLVKHFRTHTGEKPFACNVCDKRYYHKNNLDSHIRTHTGEKPFTCHVCGKQFNLKHHLVQHMLIHSGVKPFICNVCDKQFYRNDYLVQHMRIHTGEKPFACTVCDKQFNQKCTLVLHMRTHKKK